MPWPTLSLPRKPLPWALLFAALLGLQVLDETPLVSLQEALFDTYQRWFPRQRDAIPVVVVEIDEKSLAQEGQWPWPRHRVGALVEKIAAAKPLVIGLDMVFPEPDHLGPEALQRRYPSHPALKTLPDPDQRLSATLQGKPVVLGVFGTQEATLPHHRPGHPPIFLHQGKAQRFDWISFPASLASLPTLVEAAQGEGLLNATVDGSRFGQGVVRRLPLVAQIHQQPIATLGLEMLRQATGNESILIQTIASGSSRIGTGEYTLPTDARGNLLLHFGHWQADRYLSAADLLSGKTPADDLQGRLVLIGLTGLGLVDQITTPLGEKLPGVDIHAQVIESLLAGEALRRPFTVLAVESVVLLAVGLLLMGFMPQLKPRHTAGLAAVLLVTLVGIGVIWFRLGHWLFDGVTLAVLLTPLFIVLLRDALVTADHQRRTAEEALQQSREAAAKVAGELGAARRIQLGLLPDPMERFEKETRVEVAALLEPAREIGGDYYDCFMLDDRRLCLSIGDVTGKGVPASLFMAISKTLCGTMSRLKDGDPGASLVAVAEELNRENPHYLFVTTVLAVLDIDTGEITYACAGHEAPILKRGEETLRLEVEAISGPPLCALRDYPFESTRAQLQPGDLVCLFTDGINEATDGQQFYGTERVVSKVASLPPGVSPQACLDALYEDTEAFMAGHPPADDRTLLVFRWWGPAGNPFKAP